MKCRSCGTANSPLDHRCRRCGRRLAEVHLTQGALATAPAPAPETQEFAPPQPSLFPGRPQPKVIPFESLPRAARPAPRRVAPPSAPPSAAAPAVARPEPRRSSPSTSAPKRQDQPTLDFLPSAHQPARSLPTRAPAVIYCDAPVATPAHRAIAAAIDFALALMGYALFLGASWFCGAEFVLNKTTMPVYGAAFLLIAMFYHLLWMLASGETPGMQWTQLRLVNFDGMPVERRERFNRYVSGCLSYAAAGLGVLWALVDEESLTWHDHISKTFPTLREIDRSPVRKA